MRVYLVFRLIWEALQGWWRASPETLIVVVLLLAYLIVQFFLREEAVYRGTKRALDERDAGDGRGRSQGDGQDPTDPDEVPF